MKHSLIFFALFFSVKIINAQLLKIPGLKGRIDTAKIIKLKPVGKNLATAKFLYNTDKGGIYTLPIDNMPCLVSSKSDNMPVARMDMTAYKKMPNALLENKIIPEINLSEIKIISRSNRVGR